ncbi:MAG: COX15/CtaA family protein [Rhodospirillaceae bacterium]
MTTPHPTAIAATPAARLDLVAVWLFVIAVMIFAMVVLGGVTRLTESGLSMVDWRPVTGWLPPMGEAAWQKVFDAYRTSPEYKRVNAGMSLDDFKGIFWLEYLHRLFGRVIGLAFFFPFVFFLSTGRLRGGLRWKCGAMFVLGGLQGGLGWYMVKSGLVDQPDVSQYRLAAHLGLALVIYLYVLWTAFGIVQHRSGHGGGPAGTRAAAVLALVFLTVISGAFVAGLNAGLIYDTFPLMGGQLVPPEAFGLEQFHQNLFEDRATVQFDHRVLAMTTVAAVLAFWLGIRRSGNPGLRRAGGVALAAVAVQAGLGISTLVNGVPLVLAALHQAGAVVLLTAVLWAAHQARR